MIKQNKLQVALYGLLVLLPLLWVLCILFCNGYKFDLSILVPVWDDEVGWHNQVSAVIEYGHPLGYYGYNGTHAQVGTWGPWGVAPLLPYAAFGKLFGWGFSSMALANIFFLCLALLLLVIMTKPSVGQTLWLILLYSGSFITIGYSMTSMSEGLRYSLAIVLTGGLIWLERHTRTTEKLSKKEIGSCVVLGVFLLYAIQVYLVFVLALPVYCWYILRRIHLREKQSRRKRGFLYAVKFLAIIFITGVVTVVSNKMVTAVCAPYVDSTITTIFKTISERGLYQGACFFLDNFFQNLRTVDLFSIFSMASDTYGILSWFFVNYLVLLFALLLHILKHRRRLVQNRSYCYEAAFFMTGFLIGYCALYTGQEWTLCRGINTGLLMGAIYLAFADKKENLKLVLILLTFFEITAIWGYYSSMADERFGVSQNLTRAEAEKETLQELIKLDADAAPWDNTVATYGTVDFRYLVLPAGYGSNYMLDFWINESAGYAVITQGEWHTEEMKNRLVRKGHKVLLEGEYFVVLQNERLSNGKE